MITALAFGVPAALTAQGYVDDDIYYNSSKSAKKTTLSSQETTSVQTAPVTAYTDYLSSDYSSDLAYYEESPRDVDEYNRRGAVDTAADEDSLQEDFTYTRRIEKYYNPSVVTESGDQELVETYYSTEPEINIIVSTPYWWDWWYPYSWWSWSWGWGSSWYWNSWYGGLYWGWDPFWSWAGWRGPSWGPYYHHYAGFRPGAGMHSWRPSAGANRPRGGSAGTHHGTTHHGISGSSGGSGNSSVRPSSANSTSRRSTSSSSGTSRTNSWSSGRSAGSSGSSYSRPSGNTSRGSFGGGSSFGGSHSSGGHSSGGGHGGRR